MHPFPYHMHPITKYTNQKTRVYETQKNRMSQFEPQLTNILAPELISQVVE